MSFSSYQVQEMVVTTECAAGNPYIFGAKELGSDGNAAPSSAEENVRIVMPVGGPETGLYRSPKRGDYVLVGKPAADNYYLMGYIPKPAVVTDDKKDQIIDAAETDTNNPTLTGKGMVLRYQQTGKVKAPAGAHYSEIGFYSEQTAWKAPSPADYQSGANENPPKIDRLNIQSTGDIHQSALNHQSLNAKRFELLVDCDEVDHATEKTAKGERPFGDRTSDDSNLYAGDAHIRAKNRIVIKAGEEIRLQVGRSVIVITDEGIVLNSRKSHSNVTTPWDTILALSAREGASMSGEHVSIGAAHDFSISEAWGASIKSLGGVMRLSAKDIKLTAVPAKAYLLSTIAAAGQFADAVAAISCGIANKDNDIAFVNTVPSLVGAGANVLGLLGSGVLNMLNTVPSPGDIVGTMTTAIGVIQQVLHRIVYTVTDKLIKSKDEYERDSFDLAAMILDFVSMAPLVIAILAKSTFKPLHNSYLHLTTDAQAVMGGFQTKQFYIENKNASGPAAGLDSLFSPKAKKRIAAGTIGLGLIGAGIGGWQGYEQFDRVNKVDAATLAALKEL